MRDLRQYLRPVPPGWQIVEDGRHLLWPGVACQAIDGLCVIASVDVKRDNKAWLHVSMSRKSRLPSYEDMARVKRLFIGDESTAYQIFPPANEHVNTHEFCLHLWCCIDGRVTPDFRENGQI